MAEENKMSFQKLTEDLDKLNEEPVEKSEGLENAEPVQDPAEEPKEEPKEEEKVEEAKAEEAEEPAEEPKEEQPEEEGEKVEEEPKPEADPEKGEEVEKSEKPEKEEDDKDAKDKGKGKPKKKAEDKEEKDEVKKSAEPSISEADFIGAFEAVVKSFGSVQKNQASLEDKVEALSKSLAEVLAILKPEEVEKSAGEEQEEKVEEVEKSVQEDEEPEGKAVESIVKSEDGVVVPEVEAEVEQEEEAVFNPKDHVDAVMAFYMNPASNLSSDDRFNLRAAMNRVNRNEANEADIAAFKQIAGFDAK